MTKYGAPGASAAEALLLLEPERLVEEERSILRAASKGILGLHLVRRADEQSMLLLDLLTGTTCEVARIDGIDAASVLAGRLVVLDGHPELLASIDLGNRCRGRIEQAQRDPQAPLSDGAWTLVDDLLADDEPESDDMTADGCTMTIDDEPLALERARELARGRDGWSHEVKSEIEGMRTIELWWWPPASTGLDPERPRRVTVEDDLVEFEAFDPEDAEALLPIAAELFAGIGRNPRVVRLTPESIAAALARIAESEVAEAGPTGAGEGQHGP